MDRNNTTAAASADRLQTAWTELRRGAVTAAEAIVAAVLNAAPNDVQALHLAGSICAHKRQPRRAAEFFHRAAAIAPGEPAIFIALGRALRELGDHAGAVDSLRRATELAPASANAWFEYGKVLKADSRIDEARDALEKSLQLDPALLAARGSLGDVYRSVGDIERAAANYRACLSDPMQAPRAWHRLANLKTIRLSHDDAKTLQALYDAPTLAEADRIAVGYALMKALEDQRRYEEAFAQLDRVSRLQRSRVTWDASAFSDSVTRIQTAFETIDPLDSAFGSEAIFIVSMPRAGSTLLEQMLGSHPSIAAGGERQELEFVLDAESQRRRLPFARWVTLATDDDWHRLGAEYLQRTERYRGSKPRLTDKGLNNWFYVGAAARMLPGARFVDCRRDALETCLSCYRQLFSLGNAFSYDIAELAAYRHDYDRLTRFWHQRDPTRMFALSYEGLTQSPEAQTRELLDFLDLPFDKAVLDFHTSTRPVHTFSAAQVRQPLQKDTARAARYGRALDPLREALTRHAASGGLQMRDQQA